MSNNQQQQPPNGDRMTRVENALDRLVSIQASHDARIERLISGQADHAARHKLAELRLERIELALDSVVSVQQRHEQELDGLMEIIQRSAAETAQRFQDTGERLNALIKIVDGIIQRPPPPPAS